jgi:hypothetical protein
MLLTGIIAAIAMALLTAGIPTAAAASSPFASTGRKWASEARASAASAARTFLEESGQPLLVPLGVEVFLIGFDGDGGYSHRAAADALRGLLGGMLPRACPRSLDTGEELGVCFHTDFRVFAAAELGEQGAELLRRIEAHIRLTGKETGVHHIGGGAATKRVLEYAVDGAALEPAFDEFLEWAYGEAPGGPGHTWHQSNPIIVINPSKVRAKPQGSAGQAQAQAQGQPPAPPPPPLDFGQEWARRAYDPADLDAEEAGYAYRWAYGGKGEAAAWCVTFLLRLWVGGGGACGAGTF